MTNHNNPTRGELKVARETLKAARAELKQFRRDVAILKREGLLQKKLYDARSVLPTRYLKSQIRKFLDVLTGNAASVKVGKKSASNYEKQGYTVKNGRVVVPVHAQEKAYARAGKIIVKMESQSGRITQIDTGLNHKNFMQWEKKIRSIKLGKNESIAFRFYGNNSYNQSYQDTDSLLQYLSYYTKIAEAEENNEFSDAIANVQIFRIERDARLPAVDRKKRRRERSASNARYHIAKLTRMSPKMARDYFKRRAQIDKDYRKNLTDAQKKVYKEKARARSKKSREEKKKIDNEFGDD